MSRNKDHRNKDHNMFNAIYNVLLYFLRHTDDVNCRKKKRAIPPADHEMAL